MWRALVPTNMECFFLDNREGKRPFGRSRRRCDNNIKTDIKPLNAELNPICPSLALVGAHHILHVSRVMVKGRVVRYGPDLSV